MGLADLERDLATPPPASGGGVAALERDLGRPAPPAGNWFSNLHLPTPPSPLTVAGQAMEFLSRPLKRGYEVAGQADVAAGRSGWPWEGPKTPAQAAGRAQGYTNIVPPLLASILTSGATLPYQAAAQMATTHAMQEGGMEQKNPLGPIDVNVALSGALPYVMAGAGRALRGIGRGITRALPGQFQAAQEAAQTAAGTVAEGLRPETAAGNLYQGVQAAGGEMIPAGNLSAKAASILHDIGDNPVSPGRRVAKEFADQIQSGTASGTIDLKKLMQMRGDLGESIGRSPQVKALYGAALSDLESAAAAGGTGASMARSALDASKAERGADLFTRMVEGATKDTTAGGRGLNVASLRKAVMAIPKGKTEPELARLLGPEQFQRVTDFLEQFRSLPPAMAYTWADFIKRGLASGVGSLAGLATGVAGGPAGAVAGWMLPELWQNARLAGRNPAALNAVLGGAATAARAGYAGAQNPTSPPPPTTPTPLPGPLQQALNLVRRRPAPP